jgi:hypothetical protein
MKSPGWKRWRIVDVADAVKDTCPRRTRKEARADAGACVVHYEEVNSIQRGSR